MLSSPDTPRRSPCLLGRQQSLHARCRLVQVAGAYMHAYGMPTTSSILVTCPVTLNLANSIKCVGDPAPTFLTCSPYYALLAVLCKVKFGVKEPLLCRSDVVYEC